MESEVRKPSIKDKANDKLKKATKRIIKQNKEKGTLSQELAVFDEIRSLLEKDDEAQDQPSQSLTSLSQESKYEIVYNVFDPPAAFTLFSEDSLKLKLLMPEDQTLYGLPIVTRGDKFFRNLLLSRAFELREDDTQVSERIRLYVFYLAAVSSNTLLVSACFDFLSRFPCTLTINDVFSVFLNFGVTLEVVNNSEEVDIPGFLLPGIDRRQDFPAFNIEKIANILCLLIEKGFFEVTAEVKPLSHCVASLTQDTRVRQFSLLAPLSSLLTTIAVKAEEHFGFGPTSSWLHVPTLHPLLQLDLCRIGLRPLSPELQHMFIVLTINTVLKTKLAFIPPLQIGDLKVILRSCNQKKKSLSLIELRVVIELITATLPVITANFEDIKPITTQLSAIECAFVNCRDSADLMMLTSATAKLHSLVMIKGGSRFAANTNNILCSPSRPDRS